MAASQRQVNVRLPAKMVATIEAAAILEEESIAEFLKPHLDELVAQLDKDPAVQTIIRLRAERAAQKEGKLAPISQKKQSGGAA
jgi:uncharacterized protein (DUF1778 family)